MEFQYGKLSKDCRAHDPIFKALKKHGLPDSLSDTHSDSLSNRLQEEEEEKDKEKEEEKEGECEGDEKADSEVEQEWNSHDELPKIRSMGPDRKKALKARLKEPFFRENFRAAINRICQSRFCLGDGPRGWRADIDFLLAPGSVARILEGKYDGTAKPAFRPESNQRIENLTAKVIKF